MRRFGFTVEWGVWTGYFAEKYLAEHDFSGHLELGNGRVERVERIVFPKDAWGPFIFSKQYEPYGKTEWNSFLRNGFDGVRVTVLAEDDAAVRVSTNSGTLRFTLSELTEKGHIAVGAGGKYSLAVIHAEPEDPRWRLAPLLPGEARLSGPGFSGRQAELFGVSGVLVPPGESASGEFALPLPRAADELERIFVRCHVRFLISESPDSERRARGLPDFSILLGGREAYRNRKFTTYHDTNSQFLEDVEFCLPAEDFVPGKNSAEIVNRDGRFSVLIQMLRFVPEVRRHMQVTSCPKWVLAGTPFCVCVRCLTGAAKLKVEYDPELFGEEMPGTKIEFRHQMYRGKHYPIPENEEFLWEGEHEFFFVAKRSFRGGTIRFTDVWTGETSEAVVSESWAVRPEPEGMKTGVEIKTGTPWEYGRYVRKIRDEQLGNMVVFRDYHNRFTHYEKLWEAAADCRRYGLYTDAVSMKDQNIVAAASADRCVCVGGHECTGIFYGSRPPQNLSLTMRDAQRTSVNLLRTVAEGYRIPGVPVATGDASGGSRNAYLAGFDVLRHETFVGHHLLILPNARGCARAFHKTVWGAHLATQHNAQPELEGGLRRFRLGFFMAWVFGANFIFEEDSLFLCFKYYRMAEDDFLPRRKKELCAAFHKYAQTHPRQGRPKVDVAVLQGRFAPPFSGISTTNYGDPPAFRNEDFPVWGMAGREEWEWGFRQPEKGFHLLEALAPGICLNPLNQDPERVRRFFSGDPRGEFDFLPVEADSAVFSEYRLMLLLNWHTMEEQTERQDAECSNDYERFLRYARDGGTLFLAVPHLTTRADRGFLREMDDLAPIYGGDVADLCGVTVKGKSGTEFSGAVGAGDYFTDADLSSPANLIRLPNASPDEDGPCMLADVELAGAEPVAVDKKTGKPLIVRHRLGKGFVYLLCTWAYPGHEALKTFLYRFLCALIGRAVPRAVSVADPSGEVYWSIWTADKTAGKLYLLNTDWTSSGNVRNVTVRAGGCSFPFAVPEGGPREISFTEDAALFTDENAPCLSFEGKDGGASWYSLSGFGGTVLNVFAGVDLLVRVGKTERRLKASGEPYRLSVDFEKEGHRIPVTVVRERNVIPPIRSGSSTAF